MASSKHLKWDGYDVILPTVSLHAHSCNRLIWVDPMNFFNPTREGLFEGMPPRFEPVPVAPIYTICDQVQLNNGDMLEHGYGRWLHWVRAD